MTHLKNGWNGWKKTNPNLNLEIFGAYPTPQIEQALLKEGARRLQEFTDGVKAYRAHPFTAENHSTLPHVIAQEGSTCLRSTHSLDQIHPDQTVYLIMPSLINRYAIVDLSPDCSFVHTLSKISNHPVLVIDWGYPQAEEQFITIEGLIERTNRLLLSLPEIQGLNLIGYCMGGILALALAHHLPPPLRQKLDHFIAVATPYDFQAEWTEIEIKNWNIMLETLTPILKNGQFFPVDLLQICFLSVDPLSGFKKFIKFNQFVKENNQTAIKQFIAIEDWLNDGVPMAGSVAAESLSWYHNNAIISGQWQVLGRTIHPQTLSCPTLVVTANKDRLVPYSSAIPFVADCPNAKEYTMNCGHIGMMADPNFMQELVKEILKFTKANTHKP